MILIVVAAVVLWLVLIRLAVPGVRRLRMASELRGDWWTRFERDLRHYTQLQGARDAERRA